MGNDKKKKSSSVIRIEGNSIEPKYEGYIVFEDLLLSQCDMIENTRTGSIHVVLDSAILMEKILLNEESISIPNVIIEPIHSGEIRLFLKVTNSELIVVSDRYSGIF